MKWPPVADTSTGNFTPNVLNATYYFDGANGKRKMMELEVRHWITNHEAEIGTGAYGSGGVPAAGLTPRAGRRSAEKQQSLGTNYAKTNTIGNIIYGSN